MHTGLLSMSSATTMSNSCPELDALVARVGLDAAMEIACRWIGARDAEAFLRNFPPTPEPPAPGTEGETPLAAGGGGLCATASGGAGLCATASGDYQDPRADDCELHGPMRGGGLWYAPNSSGYSTFSPPCNGCADGQRDSAAGLWMSGFGVGGLAAASSAASPPTRRHHARLQTVMLDCLREAEAEPTAQWRIDNLVNAMERFRAAGGGEGDNYRYCEERFRALCDGR